MKSFATIRCVPASGRLSHGTDRHRRPFETPVAFRDFLDDFREQLIFHVRPFHAQRVIV